MLRRLARPQNHCWPPQIKCLHMLSAVAYDSLTDLPIIKFKETVCKHVTLIINIISNMKSMSLLHEYRMWFFYCSFQDKHSQDSISEP